MSSFYPERSRREQILNVFPCSAAFARVLAGSAFSRVYRRSFLAVVDASDLQVRFRYNLPICQAGATNMAQTLSISTPAAGYPVSE